MHWGDQKMIETRREFAGGYREDHGSWEVSSGSVESRILTMKSIDECLILHKARWEIAEEGHRTTKLSRNHPYPGIRVIVSGCQHLNHPGLVGKSPVPGFRATDSGKSP
ncbi:hypothetical protein BHE74_00027568, partial [Ensete ventricosum]